MKVVNVSSNFVTKWNGEMRGSESFEYVDFSNNLCYEVHAKFFAHAVSIKTLLLSQNLLGFVLDTGSAGVILGQMRNMTYLDLSQNRIAHLPRDVFQGNVNLRHLHLGDNLLHDFDVNLEHMLQLKYLNLSSNQLATLSAGFRNTLDRQSSVSNVTVNLQNNRLQCTCAQLDFLQWLVTTSVHFENRSTYECHQSGNTTVVHLDQLRRIVNQLEKDCASYFGLILGVTVAIVTAIIITVGGVVYRYRWQLRYWYYVTKNKYGPPAPTDLEAERLFTYDAFISYADEDLTFVKNDVIQNLETNAGYQLCIHHRDFRVGSEIASNIINAIQSSRKTAIVLSRKFLQSYWCRYEFEMARLEGIHTGRNVLFIIILEPIPQDELSRYIEMVDVLRTKSYIEYPDDPQGNLVFWDKCVRTIREQD
jgi:hypothetical protein